MYCFIGRKSFFIRCLIIFLKSFHKYGRFQLKIKKLWLYNFRNYKELNMEFSEKNNLILGNNGAGKTNILEALYYLSTSKSFKNRTDKDIKNWYSNEFSLEGFFDTEYGGLKVKFRYKDGKKELFINDSLESKISNIIGKIFVVPFFFNDIYLISGSPANRRSFIDIVLSMVDPYYFKSLKDYISAVRQKSSLLRNNNIEDKTLISIWNEKISESASYLILKRQEIVEYFNDLIGKLKDKLYYNKFLFAIKYQSMLNNKISNNIDDIKNNVLEMLSNNVKKEIALKSCLYGPHRDDFVLYKDNFTLRRFGSVGEGRITSIILKKCQIEFYREVKGVLPILLIDDVFLELDIDRRRLSKEIIGDNFQIFITSTSKSNIPDNMNYEKVFHITDGKVKREV